jgi:hypothetical protein
MCAFEWNGVTTTCVPLNRCVPLDGNDVITTCVPLDGNDVITTCVPLSGMVSLRHVRL